MASRGNTSSVELTGDWERLRNWCHWVMRGGHMPQMEKMAEQIGGMVRGTIRRHIMAQDLGWKKLAESTVEKKGHPIVYVDSGTYMSSIGLEVERMGDFDLVVSIFPDGYYEDKGKDVSEIAFYMEYGTRHMPARPLWRPVYAAAKTMEGIKNFDLEGLFSP